MAWAKKGLDVGYRQFDRDFIGLTRRANLLLLEKIQARFEGGDESRVCRVVGDVLQFEWIGLYIVELKGYAFRRFGTNEFPFMCSDSRRRFGPCGSRGRVGQRRRPGVGG